MKQQINLCEEKMEKSLNKLLKDYASIRAGRANPAVLDKINVDYYGVPTPINQLGSISVSEARTLVIQPWDLSVLPMIEKAIQISDLGINPSNDGKVIRISFPPLTEERRKEIVKEIHKLGEDCKVSIRNIRRDILDSLKNMKKTSEITEDDFKSGEKNIQNITDKFCSNVDKSVSEKEKEVMSI